MPRPRIHTTPDLTDTLQLVLVELRMLRAAMEKAGVPVPQAPPLEVVHKGERVPQQEAELIEMIMSHGKKHASRRAHNNASKCQGDE
jgi:hypothetical protein